MKILVLGNSSIFNRKVLPALIKLKNVSIEVASKRKIKKYSLCKNLQLIPRCNSKN